MYKKLFAIVAIASLLGAYGCGDKQPASEPAVEEPKAEAPKPIEKELEDITDESLAKLEAEAEVEVEAENLTAENAAAAAEALEREIDGELGRAPKPAPEEAP